MTGIGIICHLTDPIRGKRELVCFGKLVMLSPLCSQSLQTRECMKAWPPQLQSCSPGRTGKMLTEFLALSWMWFIEKEFSKRWVGAIFPLPDQPPRILFFSLLAFILPPTPSPYFLFTTDHQPHFSGPPFPPTPQNVFSALRQLAFTNSNIITTMSLPFLSLLLKIHLLSSAYTIFLLPQCHLKPRSSLVQNLVPALAFSLSVSVWVKIYRLVNRQ